MITRIGQGLATIALVVGVSACAAAGQATSSNTSSAVPTAVATVAPASGPANQAGATPGRGTRVQNQAGTVQSVSGTTVTVQRPQNGGTFTVQLSDSTTIRKQAIVAIGDVKSGTPISAVGQLNGGVLQARRIQLGGAPGAGPANGRPNGGAGTNGGAGANGGNSNNGGNGAASFVTGTVDGVSGNTITVKANDGSSSQIQLAANGQIVEQSTGTASDIAPGKFLVAFGQQQNGTVTATAVSIADAPPTGGNGGTPGNSPGQPATG